MERRNQETYQIATLVLVILTVLVCMSYLLIFFNPQIALNPLKPPLPTPTAVVLGLVPTWTPTWTPTPTRTFTPSPTPTITDTPLPTSAPSRTPSLTPTRKILARTSTPRPIVPTTVAYQYPYYPTKKCYHAGGTFIEGTVWSGSGGYPVKGVRVALGSGPNTGDIYYATTGNSGVSDGYYLFVIRQNGSAPGNYYMWVVDGNGLPQSDPNQGLITTNNISNGADPNACWRAVVDFIRR